MVNNATSVQPSFWTKYLEKCLSHVQNHAMEFIQDMETYWNSEVCSLKASSCLFLAIWLATRIKWIEILSHGSAREPS
jgi:hypothetical protein